MAGFAAAYMSTVGTQLNWGASYLINDFYKRFLNRTATEKHYVLVGRLTTALLMIIAALTTFVMRTAGESFNLILSIGAGTGLIYLLRWFWWRINAWSEVAAMASSFVVSISFFVAGRLGYPLPAHWILICTVLISTIAWVTTTYLTAPTERATLVSFYKLVRPAGPGWKQVQQEAGVGPSPDSMTVSLAGWVLGCTFVYSALFGTGSFLYGKTSIALVWLAVFVVSGLGLVRVFRIGSASAAALPSAR